MLEVVLPVSTSNDVKIPKSNEKGVLVEEFPIVDTTNPVLKSIEQSMISFMCCLMILENALFMLVSMLFPPKR